MPRRVTQVQRQAILEMLAKGMDRNTIAYQVGVTPGQVSAVSAHVKMGTYALPPISVDTGEPAIVSGVRDSAASLLHDLSVTPSRFEESASLMPIYLGTDAETKESVFWNPDPRTGAANPHVLVLGESGFGKTYAIASLLAELANQGTASLIFDYGQGFSVDSAPPEFVERTKPVEIQANRDGVDINPLQIFPSDLHGPVNVAQRIADTFCRVYDKLGIQQHSVLRQATLDAFAEQGILAGDRETWKREPPPFRSIQDALERLSGGRTPQARIAASVHSHISTIFVYNTFRPGGRKLAWADMLRTKGGVFVIQLKGLEHSLETAVTEFLLWNFIGFVESLGPAGLQCFIVLDEAHRLSFDPGTPVEKLLREGRKYGLGLILASQQPEDFSPVAFGNTSTKLVFQVGDENSAVSRQLHKKLRNSHTFTQVASAITRLPRGWAYFVSENVGRVVRIADFSERNARWKCTQ